MKSSRVFVVVLSIHLKISYFGLSDVGLVREHNEDVWKALPEKGLFLLADGMGGHQAGEIAAQNAIDKLSEMIKHSFRETAEEHLAQAIKKTNAIIYQQGRENEALSGMGTTLCCLFLHEGQAILGHVGDSRIYCLRNNRLKQLTEDHSLINELLAMHAMTEEEAPHFPYKHILTKAIGTNALIDPTVYVTSLSSGDLYLLCSDGLTNFVKDQEIYTILSSDLSLKDQSQQLVDLAKNHGGGDNITVLLVKIT